MAAPRDQASRRPPIAAVAGITMPPLERRSPWSSTETSTRSCSIRIGVLSFSSVTAGASLSGHLADDDDERDEACDPPGDLEDVVGAGVALRVDEEGAHRSNLALDDGLGAGSVEQLVDGPGELLPG